MPLHRRKIKSALENDTGWTVRTHTTGLIDAYPPQPMGAEAAKDEVVRRVRALGYEPKVVGTRDAKGVFCIQFHTPETLQQEGEGSHGFKKSS